MEGNKKYLYTFDTFDWKIVKREIIGETRYTWKTAYGTYSKDRYNSWKPNCEHFEFWDIDLDGLNRRKKEEVEHRIKLLKKDIERLEKVLCE